MLPVPASLTPTEDDRDTAWATVQAHVSRLADERNLLRDLAWANRFGDDNGQARVRQLKAVHSLVLQDLTDAWNAESQRRLSNPPYDSIHVLNCDVLEKVIAAVVHADTHWRRSGDPKHRLADQRLLARLCAVCRTFEAFAYKVVRAAAPPASLPASGVYRLALSSQLTRLVLSASEQAAATAAVLPLCSKVRRLDLHGIGDARVTAAVSMVTQLTRLELTDVPSLAWLPAALGALQALAVLRCEKCRVPRECLGALRAPSALTALEFTKTTCDLSLPALTTVPRLVRLYVEDMIWVPDGDGDAGAAPALSDLEVLYVKDYAWTTERLEQMFPQALARCPKLRALDVGTIVWASAAAAAAMTAALADLRHLTWLNCPLATDDAASYVALPPTLLRGLRSLQLHFYRPTQAWVDTAAVALRFCTALTELLLDDEGQGRPEAPLDFAPMFAALRSCVHLSSIACFVSGASPLELPALCSVHVAGHPSLQKLVLARRDTDHDQALAAALLSERVAHGLDVHWLDPSGIVKFEISLRPTV